MKIAIVVHAFYSKQLSVILDKINMILGVYNEDIDIYITLSHDRQELESILELYPFPKKIYWCQNLGMDLLPFFELIPNLQDYDWVLKLHTKNCNTELNTAWFDSLVDELIGSPNVFLDTINILKSNPKWQMAGILPFFLSAQRLMLDDKKNITKLADLWRLDVRKDWGFFSGGFYWVRPKVLSPYIQSLLKYRDFIRDKQMVDAAEQLIALIVSQHGGIGLLYEQASLCIDSKHPSAINYSLPKTLMQDIKTLDLVTYILLEVYPLDIVKYRKSVSIEFLNKEMAIKHYILVGQHCGFDNWILPLFLKKTRKLISLGGYG